MKVPGAGGCEGSGRVDGVVGLVDVLVVPVLKDDGGSIDMVLVQKKGYWIGGDCASYSIIQRLHKLVLQPSMANNKLMV